MANIINAKKFINFFEDDDVIAEMLQYNYENEEIEFDLSDFELSDVEEQNSIDNKDNLTSDSEVNDDIFITTNDLDELDVEQLEYIEQMIGDIEE